MSLSGVWFEKVESYFHELCSSHNLIVHLRLIPLSRIEASAPADGVNVTVGAFAKIRTGL